MMKIKMSSRQTILQALRK